MCVCVFLGGGGGGSNLDRGIPNDLSVHIPVALGLLLMFGNHNRWQENIEYWKTKLIALQLLLGSFTHFHMPGTPMLTRTVKDKERIYV